VSAVDGRVLPAPGPVTARVADVWARHAEKGMDP
jgi:branched-chain amino acid aminotransferase